MSLEEAHFVVPVDSFYINIFRLTTQPGSFGELVLAPAWAPSGPASSRRPTLDLAESWSSVRTGQRRVGRPSSRPL